MKLGSDQNRLTLLAVTALVAHAPILVFPPAHRMKKILLPRRTVAHHEEAIIALGSPPKISSEAAVRPIFP